MATQYPIPKSNPNAVMSISFFLLWVVTGVVIAVANNFFPDQFVLGTMSLSYTAALVLSSGVLAGIATLTMPIFTAIEMAKQMVMSPGHWSLGYLVINFITVWAVARFADVLGLGVASWMYVLGLAIALDVAQGIVMMAYGAIQQRNK